DQEIVDIDPELARIAGIERVLGVDKGAGAAVFLCFRDDMQGERGLPRAFRPVNLDYPPARQPADAERDVEAERAGRYDLNLGRRVVRAELHDRAFAEGTLDLPERRVQSPLFVHAFPIQETQCGLIHSPLRWCMPARAARLA